MNTPRGIRNNNPGNIRKSAADWRGEVEGEDTAFETFDTPEDGLRALGKILLRYERDYGLNTVRGILTRYAPACENDTAGYIAHVAERMGVSPDEPVDVAANLPQLMRAIVAHECGSGWDAHYSDATYDKASDMALGLA
ncbi:hypothetical protein dsx2_2497 [Desulfovibrio sp. X2]|uniref:hypothetical protein n=1 Tax=Desulfovibrio sp. X2 TaxID=941449 RepID=UPI000358DEE1|nr:hypothetical protein [Desulfovibrio sp. X2]EPR43137.1 hypothetical protein dsx2_2497 [Desulfovibrio sp. X2]